MKTILNYNSFLLEAKIDKMALKYINEQITIEELEKYMFEDINEGLSDIFNYVKTKILDVFYTFILKAKDVASNILTKVISLASKTIAWLNKFYEKHPVLAKAIVIFIIIVIIMILSSQSAHAADIVNQHGAAHLNVSHAESCNAAIQFIDVNNADLTKILHEHGKDGVDASKILFEAKTYAKDMMDGKFDDPLHLSKEGIALGKTALHQVQELIKTSNQNHDTALMNKIMNLISEGSKHVWDGNLKV
jgi:hypothetical protein